MELPTPLQSMVTPQGILIPVAEPAIVPVVAANIGTGGIAGGVAFAMSGGGGGGDHEETGDKKASDLDVLKPGTKEWNEAAKDIGRPGKGKNYRVRTSQEAEQLLRDSGRKLLEKPTYTDETYKSGYEHHPNERNSQNAPHNDLPHIKWKDWSEGKKNGANGHIFYDE